MPHALLSTLVDRELSEIVQYRSLRVRGRQMRSVTQSETTEAQKQKSNFLCMTAIEPGAEDMVEDKHGNRYT